MESNLSQLSSLAEEDNPVYIQPHYKESYRLAIYALLCGGREAYEEFLRAEQISPFLSNEEILFMLENGELPDAEDDSEIKCTMDTAAPSTYFPSESDEEVPDLELGWPEVSLEATDTSISLLFNPPRINTPSIKEVVRKQIQDARQVIAIAMDVFTDVDIFKEIITATLRGVAVYILLDDSHFSSFLAMSVKVGINVQDLKNIRVRTVQGPQYHCQSGMKFHGALEQKFILIDCQTVLYGTYSYTWSCEKINLSMALVITGQLVSSYDEEFRRLYARSTVPALQSLERSSHFLRDPVSLQNPKSSQLSLHQIHTRSRGLQAMRKAQEDRFNSATTMTRGLSIQERLHQFQYPDVGNMLRGHSYGEDLQRLNALTRLRMGTKELGVPVLPEKLGSNPRGASELLLPNRLSQQQLKHWTRYGADQNLIPFSSETSLHRWKMDTYLNDFDMPLDASCDTMSPVTSPFSSHTGLNELQTQRIHSRSRDIKSKMEEIRQKRLSLQEYSNFRQNQELKRHQGENPSFKSSFRGLDTSLVDLEPTLQTGRSLESASQVDSEPHREGILMENHRSTSYYDVKSVSDPKTAYEWNEPLSRTTSAGNLDTKPRDSPQKLSQLGGLSAQATKTLKSLTEIPEEKEGSSTVVNGSAPPGHGKEELSKDEKNTKKETNWPAGSQQVQAQLSLEPAGRAEGQKPASNEILNASAGSRRTTEAQGVCLEKGQMQCGEPGFQRKNSLRMKMYSLLASDEKKQPKKEDKSFQRKPSLRAKQTSGLSQPVRADHPPVYSVDHTAKKSQSQGVSRMHNPNIGPPDTEKHKPLQRLSTQRSSKKKTSLSVEHEGGWRSTVEEEQEATVYQRQKVYSRFEYLLTTENLSKDRSSAPNDPACNQYQTQSGSDKKLGKFMQRVGNLIGKNK